MSSVESPNAVREFGEPFNATDADIILRSVENVDFRAHRLILAHSSPLFASMFTLPTPTPGSGVCGDDEKDGLLVVTMAEDEKTLELLLRLCYPILLPVLDTIEEVASTVQVVRKFELGGAATIVEHRLLVLAPDSPVRVYALGWMLQSKKVVHIAAKEALACPILDIHSRPEYAQIPASAILQLLAYRDRCLRDVPSIASSLGSWLSNNALPAIAKGATRCGCTQSVTVTLQGGLGYPVKSWCKNYITTAVGNLQHCLRASTVQEFPALQVAIQNINSCSGGYCKTEALPALKILSGLLMAQVEKVLVEALDEIQTPF